MAKRPTIIDVAKIAGVSKSTVSLVLQNSASVKESTCEKVRAAMAETGYVYNRGAANMRAGHTGLIGLVINNLRNPFYTEFAVSTQMTFSELGFATVVANSNDDWELQEQVIRTMLEHGVDALVVAPCFGGPHHDFDHIIRAGVPTMQVLRFVDERNEIFPFCSMEYRIGGYQATEHLMAGGAKNIAFIGGEEQHSITQERTEGYAQRLQEAGREPAYFFGQASRDFGANTAKRLLREHPQIDAAFAFNDLVALGMVAGFAEAGVRLGRDFRLVGFDDIEEASQCYPKLSTVRCDVNQFGRKVAQMMLDWLNDGLYPGQSVRFPVELIVRDTS